MQPYFRRAISFTLAIAGVVFCAANGAAGEPALTPEETTFFEQKIRPLLIERCYQCHSQAKQVKGGLKLDSRKGWQKGGDTGPAIVPGKPDESLLVTAIRYNDADLRMPPAGKLAEAEIALLEEWVQRGAPDSRDDSTPGAPSSANSAAARTHWAYQPLREAATPAIRRGDWPLGDVDRFILAALEEKGLAPAPDADRYTWLRRVTLDLTGLPPTSAEIEAFVDDKSPHAWERVVDRLLASRAFGERWARFWLDLVGYADQIGSANNVPAEHAWRYRDYVIRAMQADKPFDQFIREQLAGDMLTAGSIEERQDQLTATGFLVLGNVNIVEADKLQMRMDLVDQQIEKVGKAFLGMTLNCVRCHDHKFDPVTLSDYYGLAGIFASTDSTYKEERGVWSSVLKAQLPETLEQFTRRETARRAHDRKVAMVRGERTIAEAHLKELESLIKAARENAAPPASGARPLAELEKDAAELAGKLKAIEQQLLHLAYLQPAPPLAFSVRESTEIADARMQVRGNPHVLGAPLPRGFVEVATHGSVPVIGNSESGRLQLADWLANAASPLVARVTVNRLWQRLLGRGIVASVDYFGVRGEAPTHPELLDHLARQFIRDGWSQKRLIKSLVLSRTYRQGAEGDEASRQALADDPDNRLYWRMSPRRLDAEMLRDAVLAISGSLEECVGGPALAPEFIENVGGLDPKDVNPISFSLTKFRADQQRVRSIYLPVVRSSEQRGPADVLNFFDFAQPARLTGDRPTTAVASQALFLLNSPLLEDASQKLAAELLKDAALMTDGARLGALYLRVINRLPTSDESDAASDFLSSASSAAGSDSAADKSARWQQLIHALLASNEFLFRL
jgi:hypothetical protein